MADVRIAVEKIQPNGLGATYTGSLSAANTYMIKNDGEVFLHFKKSGAGIATVTIETPKTLGGLAVAEQVVSVAADSGDEFAGPFPPNIYNDGDHDLRWASDDILGLTVAVIHM